MWICCSIHGVRRASWRPSIQDWIPLNKRGQSLMDCTLPCETHLQQLVSSPWPLNAGATARPLSLHSHSHPKQLKPVEWSLSQHSDSNQLQPRRSYLHPATAADHTSKRRPSPTTASLPHRCTFISSAPTHTVPSLRLGGNSPLPARCPSITPHPHPPCALSFTLFLRETPLHLPLPWLLPSPVRLTFK